jgi:broad specificity phosphatase PhoE
MEHLGIGKDMQLILVRHGETLWNKEGRCQGFSDVELNEVGLDQARRLALSLKDHTIGSIYASPLKRAYETAKLINDHHHIDIQVDQGLMEMNQGDFEGLSFKELMAGEKDFLKKWISDPASITMPNGESFMDVQDRAWRVVEEIIKKPGTHNFTIAALLCKVRNISLSQFRSTCVDTASKTIVNFRNGEAHIDVLNDRSHLND